MKEKRRMLKEAFAKKPRLSPNEQRELAKVVGMDYEKGKKIVSKSESLRKKKMNCLGYVLTFRSLLRVFDEGKEEDGERGLCKEPMTLAK